MNLNLFIDDALREGRDIYAASVSFENETFIVTKYQIKFKKYSNVYVNL